MNEVGILLSTCDRYRPVAEWTESLIDRAWQDHPPVVRWGLGDQRDWMTVTRDGVATMRKQGFRWIYLLLYDHPPVGPCHDLALNTVLPSLARELDAVNICLLGWGQRREKEGRKLSRRHSSLMRCDPGFRWKFSLHPSLWSVPELEELLETRIGQFAPADSTPWNFERHRDVAGGPVRAELLCRSYRVHGGAMARTSLLRDEFWRQPLLPAYDVYRFLLRIVRGQKARDAFDRESLWPYHYYRGPYPILWSGAVRAGEPSRDFENFLRFSGRRGLAQEWEVVRKKFCPAC